MSKTKITEILMLLFVIMLVPILVRADQEKTTNPPPPPPSKPAPAAKPAQPTTRPTQPTQRPAAQPTRVQPGAKVVKPAASPTTRTNVATTPSRTPNTPGRSPVTPGHAPATPRTTPTRTVQTPHGTLELGANNKPTHFVGSRGQEAHFSSKGNIRQVHDPNRNMTVEHGFRPGDRRIVTERNGRTLVSTGPGRGYMQRPYYRDRYGHAYVQRTYWVHGHPYAYAYRDHFYHGVHYYWYAPRYYYHPVFYGWVYNPWAAPVYYNWGWGPAAPWFYGGYFAPAPFYPTASLWLTDYLLAENLRAAYQEAAGGAPEFAGISTVSAQPNQTITLTGGGFGTLPPYVGDSNYIQITDVTRGWNAGYAPGADAVTLDVPLWTDSQIIIRGFRGGYGQGSWFLTDGDQVLVRVWNAQTGAGPAIYQLTVGQPAAQPAELASQPAHPEGASAAATPMSPEVKQMIDAEVQRQLHAEQAEAQSPQAQPVSDQTPPPALDPKQRLFVVSSNLGVSTAEGQECELTPGDVITRIDDNPGDDSKVRVSVMSSKPNDCAVGLLPRVAVTDLQEMHNNFRQQLDTGLDALAKNAGTGGLPKAPDAQTSAGQVPQPAPDKGVDTQLNDQQKEATQLEAEVRQEAQTANQ